MQDHLDLGFDSKFLFQRTRKQSNRSVDPYALEPWEKSTLEIQIKKPSAQNNYKTFYQSPTSRPLGNKSDRNYSTQRVFSFHKQQEYSKCSIQKINKQNNHDRFTIGSQKSSVSHYNINGNFLTQNAPTEKRRFSNQFFLRTKDKKEMKKQRIQKSRQSDVMIGVSSIDQIKRRINFHKQYSTKQDKKFVRLNSENDELQESKVHISPNIRSKRNSKVISLGFRKLSVVRGIIKQRSVNLQSYLGL